MKRLLYLAMILAAGSGCSKAIVLQKGLLGTWELRVSSGTIAGYTHKYKPGNGNTITFLDSSHYLSSYVGDDTTSQGSGTYKLTKGSDCSGNEVTLISYPPNEFSSAIFISDDTLHIDDNCISDGVYNTYVKIR